MANPDESAHMREELPELLFVERAAVVDPVTIEVDRPGAMHPRAAGFWRHGDLSRGIQIVETRYEVGQTLYPPVTDRGCLHLMRFGRLDPHTLRLSDAW